MYLDFGLASVHHVLILVVASVLAGEAVLLRVPPTGGVLERLARLDLLYGVCAALLLAVGAGRVLYGAKGSAYHLHNPMFWVKMALFALVGALSLVPTLRFLRWLRAWKANAVLPNPAEWSQTCTWVFVEIHLLTGVVIAAAAMARGLGYTW